MNRELRDRPDLDQLKRQAKELLEAFAAGDADAIAEVRSHFRNANTATFALHDAQLVLARAYGFSSWTKLKAYVDGVTLKRMIEAVCAGDVAQVRAMLHARPELVNMQTAHNDERRPLHYAVLNRAPEIVRLLMRQGADAASGVYPHRDATGALTIATERGYDEIAAIILQEQQSSADEQNEPEPAATPLDIDWLRARHAEGSLVNPIDWWKGGLLTAAVKQDRRDVLLFLLDGGFDPNERVRSPELEKNVYSQGFPLWHAAALGKFEMVELLLQRGADPNVHVYAAGSAVYSAYSHRQWKIAELLQAHGGIVTADIAALYRLTERAQELLDDAEQLLDHGASGGASEIVRMALEHIQWPPEDPRWFHMLRSPLSFWNHIPWLHAGNPELDRGTYIDCFKQILARCGPNRIGRFHSTMLHEVAALRDYVTEEEGAPFAAALLEAGARMDIRDDMLKSTPLGWACRWGRIEVVKLLLQHGADPIEADAEPWATPAAWAKKRAHGHVLALLHDHGKIS